jgi:hypothetical protein
VTSVPAKTSPLALRWIVYACAGLAIAAGPALLALAILLPDDFPLGILIGAIVTLLCAPLGVFLVTWVRTEHRATLTLRERGLPATAEVLATSLSYGEETRLVLTLSIRGPGITPFTAEHSTAEDSALSVGDRLTAIVDPRTNVFAIPVR